MPLVIVSTLEPASPLAEPGDTKSPVINAITEALSGLGAELQSAEHQQFSDTFPPTYLVIVETSGVDQEEFEKALQLVWPEGQPYGDDAIPPR
ncbi:hypothetical protein N7481_011222 [Penicillium waksmanii]|uniref:uncharacterized protein n=1 Tax=Penicillium waksmanii TaxID=69791 RepID=UPI0025480B86|nr:uncharacterized protein N7481_011222 [Penicillium waksmanii]KAJ5974012.1 hypothetical protein N7481_011222 [Penicillium waksmanii]